MLKFNNYPRIDIQYHFKESFLFNGKCSWVYASRLEGNTSLKKVKDFLEKKWFNQTPKELRVQLSLFADPKTWCSNISQFEGGAAEKPLSDKLLLTDVFAGYNLDDPSKVYLYYDLKITEVPSYSLNETSMPIIPNPLDEGIITNFTNFSMLQAADSKLPNFDSKNGYDSFGVPRINLFGNTLNSEWNASRNNFNQSLYMNDRSQVNNNLFLSPNHPVVTPNPFSMKKGLQQTQPFSSGFDMAGASSLRNLNYSKGDQAIEKCSQSSLDPSSLQSRKKMDFSCVNVMSQPKNERKLSFAGKFSKKNSEGSFSQIQKEESQDLEKTNGRSNSQSIQSYLGKHLSSHILNKSTELQENNLEAENQGDDRIASNSVGAKGTPIFSSLTPRRGSEHSRKLDGSIVQHDSMSSNVSDSLKKSSFMKHPIHEKNIKQMHEILQKGDKFEANK